MHGTTIVGFCESLRQPIIVEMLTRSDFETACKGLAESDKIENPHLKGWIWREHPQFTGLGFLERTSSTSSCKPRTRSAEDVRDEICEEDAATMDAPLPTFLRVWQSIAYSVSFQMPVFFFSVYTDEGTPFSLPDIVDFTPLFLFQPNSTEAVDFKVTNYSIQGPGATLPLISQGEHPTLGTPCFYLHPCETQVALRELIEADERSSTPSSSVTEERSKDSRGEMIRKLELWLLLVGNAVDLRISHSHEQVQEC